MLAGVADLIYMRLRIRDFFFDVTGVDESG
jgi:hypothetical protein